MAGKSLVTFAEMVPVPPTLVVRTWYVKLVVPLYGVLKLLPDVDKLVVPVVTVSDASAGTTTDSVVVPCARTSPATASTPQATIVMCLFNVCSP